MTGVRLAQPAVIGALLLVLPAAVFAQGQTGDAPALRGEIEQLRNELQAIQKQYGDRLTALEAKLGAAEGAAPPAPSQAAQVPGPSLTSKVFNPDMAVVGNFLGAAGRNLVNPAPAL